MPLTQAEFETLITDGSKRIEGDLDWVEDEDHSPAVQFRAEILSDAGYPLFVRGRFNGPAGTLSYVLMHRGSGRVYGLDLGADHHNPGCDRVGEVHKHRWTDQYADKQAYRPDDIGALATDPLAVWREFCAEAKITHRGRLLPPPAIQMELGI
jgi:hypothetical protein